MTKVANSVIVASTCERDEWAERIISKVFVRADGCEQSFLQVHMNGFGDKEFDDDALLAGGSVYFESDVFAAAFNHIEPEVIADWFESLPWQKWDDASLTIHGNDYPLFVLVVGGESRRTVGD